ncbi:MAG: biotin--[acetyl-CoA-carboxylase] ligase [Candidatus Omnitrophica bacterium]|nr:biotin--[acetyl-CoA-carboxylase] ligase [Candidatus Omnitrophota bacterium]
MRDKILEYLKKTDSHISGEELSQRLKISRAGIWKHIQELRESGYEIVAVPHLGYRLFSIPDKLLPQEIACGLKTKSFGCKIRYYEMVSSTMDIAMQAGLEGALEGELILAEGQSRGRGRLGRSWNSPKYKGIYMSLILRPKLLPQETPCLTLLSAVSVCEAIKEDVGLDTNIKWPNDIVIHEKKVGGILTELNAEMDIVHFVVIGIGINVNNDKSQLPLHATSLKEEKKEVVNRVTLLRKILEKLEINYDIFKKHGFHPITEKWRSFSTTLGSRIKVTCQKEHIEGEAIDIDIDGGLIIRKDSGFIEKVMAGDVVKVR